MSGNYANTKPAPNQNMDSQVPPSPSQAVTDSKPEFVSNSDVNPNFDADTYFNASPDSYAVTYTDIDCNAHCYINPNRHP